METFELKNRNKPGLIIFSILSFIMFIFWIHVIFIAQIPIFSKPTDLRSIFLLFVTFEIIMMAITLYLKERKKRFTPEIRIDEDSLLYNDGEIEKIINLNEIKSVSVSKSQIITSQGVQIIPLIQIKELIQFLLSLKSKISNQLTDKSMRKLNFSIESAHFHRLNMSSLFPLILFFLILFVGIFYYIVGYISRTYNLSTATLIVMVFGGIIAFISVQVIRYLDFKKSFDVNSFFTKQNNAKIWFLYIGFYTLWYLLIKLILVLNIL